MHMALVIGLRRSRFSCFCSDFKKWCRGDRSRASLVPDACHSVTCPAIPLCLPLMASLTLSAGDLAMVTSGLPRPVVAPVPGVPGAGAPGSAAPGDTALALGSSGATSPRVSGLYLPGSPGFPPPPISWRQVGDEAESMCLRVITTERLCMIH
jgi:hypothetical protein